MNNRPSRGGRRQRRAAFCQGWQTPPFPPRRIIFLAWRPSMCRPFLLAFGGVFALASCSFAQSPPAKDVVRLAEIRFRGWLGRAHERASGNGRGDDEVRQTDDSDRRHSPHRHGPAHSRMGWNCKSKNRSAIWPAKRSSSAKTPVRICCKWAIGRCRRCKRRAIARNWKSPSGRSRCSCGFRKKTPPDILKNPRRRLGANARLPDRGPDRVADNQSPFAVFGEQLLKLCDLRSVHLRGQRGETEITLDSAKTRQRSGTMARHRHHHRRPAAAIHYQRRKCRSLAANAGAVTSLSRADTTRRAKGERSWRGR